MVKRTASQATPQRALPYNHKYVGRIRSGHPLLCAAIESVRPRSCFAMTNVGAIFLRSVPITSRPLSPLCQPSLAVDKQLCCSCPATARKHGSLRGPGRPGGHNPRKRLQQPPPPRHTSARRASKGPGSIAQRVRSWYRRRRVGFKVCETRNLKQ